jgi:uncharacterized protein YecT (DUF1311 family)
MCGWISVLIKLPQEYSLAQDLAILKCLAQAYEMWDKELNKVYGELMQQLNDKEKKIIKRFTKEMVSL